MRSTRIAYRGIESGRARRARLWCCTVMLGLGAGLGLDAAADAGPLTLRVNDTSGEAGSRVAVVLRTYAARPLGQGQLCFRARSSGAGGQGPFLQLEEALVFSEGGDAVVEASFQQPDQLTVLEFLSQSATVNNSDGPLAVLFYRLRGDLLPGEAFEVQFDEELTQLWDASGQTVSLELRAGEVEVAAAGEPKVLEVDGDVLAAGGGAQVRVGTEALFPISEGRVGLRYDPQLTVARPTLSIDPRYGSASLQVEHPEPGLVIASFRSADSSLNRFPGGFLRVYLPTPNTLSSGSVWTLTLDPGLSSLQSPDQPPYALILEGDEVAIEGQALFAETFEQGHLQNW